MFLKKVPEIKRITIAQSGSYLLYQKYLKSLFGDNFQITLIIFFRIFNLVFKKTYSPQHCLILMIDTWKKAVDNNKVLGALLADLSKAFDCICHDLLEAKLNGYCLFFCALKKIQGYMRTKRFESTTT